MSGFTMEIPTLTTEGAKHVLAAAEEVAAADGLKVSIAVVDAAGHLLAFSRRDRAAPLSVAVALAKARTAAELGTPTSVFQQMVDGGKPSLLAVEGLTAAKGGVPIMHSGEAIGGVGVSGASGEEDERVAEAGAAAFA